MYVTQFRFADKRLEASARARSERRAALGRFAGRSTFRIARRVTPTASSRLRRPLPAATRADCADPNPRRPCRKTATAAIRRAIVAVRLPLVEDVRRSGCGRPVTRPWVTPGTGILNVSSADSRSMYESSRTAYHRVGAKRRPNRGQSGRAVKPFEGSDASWRTTGKPRISFRPLRLCPTGDRETSPTRRVRPSCRSPRPSPRRPAARSRHAKGKRKGVGR